MTSRRVFLRDGGLALLSLGFAPTFLARTAAAASTRTKLLIAIFQRGAVDGLNVVVPYGERDYYRRRPSIAIPRPGDGADTAVDLDGFFAFHPRLAPLVPLYRTGTLAVVHACGSPDSTRSHFDAQDYMESATPGVKSTDDGWLNRTLRAERARRSSPFRAVARADPATLAAGHARRHWPSGRSAVRLRDGASGAALGDVVRGAGTPPPPISVLQGTGQRPSTRSS